jgi:hypothetical protein
VSDDDRILAARAVGVLLAIAAVLLWITRDNLLAS